MCYKKLDSSDPDSLGSDIAGTGNIPEIPEDIETHLKDTCDDSDDENPNDHDLK